MRNSWWGCEDAAKQVSHKSQTIWITSISQNHRMVGVGRDLCGSSSPTLLPKQGHLQQAAEDLVQAGLEYLQRRRLHNLPGQPVPGLRHPQREEVLPHVQVELPLLQFVPIAPCPVTGHHWKESGPILLMRLQATATRQSDVHVMFYCYVTVLQHVEDRFTKRMMIHCCSCHRGYD